MQAHDAQTVIIRAQQGITQARLQGEFKRILAQFKNVFDAKTEEAGAPPLDVPPLPEQSDGVLKHASLEELEEQVAAEEAEAIAQAEAAEIAAKEAEQEAEEASSKRSQNSLKKLEHQRLQADWRHRNACVK